MKNGSRGARSTTRRCAAVRNSDSSGERVAVTLTRSPPSLSAVRWRLGEKLPKTGKKASFFPKIPFAKPVFGKKRKNSQFFARHRNGQRGMASRFYKWCSFTATTWNDPKFGMHFLCTETKWAPSSDQKSNRGLFIENLS